MNSIIFYKDTLLKEGVEWYWSDFPRSLWLKNEPRRLLQSSLGF